MGIDQNLYTNFNFSIYNSHSDLEKNQNKTEINKIHDNGVYLDNTKSGLSIIYRLKEKPAKPLSSNYLIVFDQIEKLFNGKPAPFDIFNLTDFSNHFDVIKQLKRLNRQNIGIEVKVKDIQNSLYSHDVGRWIRCIQDIYKFCKLSDNQFILSSGTNSKYGLISDIGLESMLKVCEVDPKKYWKDLEKWLEIKKKVYYDVTS